MLKADVYSAKGTKLGIVSLPKDFEAKENLRLLAQAIRVYEDRTHPGLAKVKTRADVNRTKKKWYRQKGTGGARHGARSAPIFVGGGVAHGPTGVKRQLSLPEKMKEKALSVAISLKIKNKEGVVVDGLAKINKTKEIDALIKKLAKSLSTKAKKFTFVLSNENLRVRAAIKNIKNTQSVSFKDLNPYKVFYGGILVIDKRIFTKKKKV